MTPNPQSVNNQTYTAAALQLAAHFKAMGARVADIERAFALAGNPHEARVLEIGCGDGRDATEIVKRTPHYLGFDPSEGMLNLARQNVSTAEFVLATASTFHYPRTAFDIVLAFASLLHVPQSDLAAIITHVHESLRSGGIFYVSTKESETYREELQTDEFGERYFYYYNSSLLEELAGAWFENVYEDHQRLGTTAWLTIALKKR